MENLEVYDDMTNSEIDGKYLTFWTDSQLFGIPIADVVQIIGMQEITPIPEFPEYAKGIINLRGSVIPVIDVRLRLQKKEAEYDERTCIIVSEIGGIHIGFIVDAVDSVIDIADDCISDPPNISSNMTNVFLSGIAKLNGRIALLINIDKFIAENVLTKLSIDNE